MLKTPYFMIYEDELKKNVMSFENALQEYWPNYKIAYSVKTNSLPWVLKFMHNRNIMAEVVSDEEYQLAKICGFQDNEIVFNGPIKSEKFLHNALKNSAIVNLDSERELYHIINNKYEFRKKLGVRINVDTSLFKLEDIGYQEDGFRFGFSLENGRLKEIIGNLCSLYDTNEIGLHLHCNSITRSIDVYRTIAKYACFIIKECGINPPFIDVGGGFFGGVEGKPTASQYINVIKEELEEVVNVEKTMLIVEPGSALIGSVVDLHTSVIDIKKTKYANIITTDGSRINVDPLWKKTSYMYSVNSQNETSEVLDKQIVCGYTCTDHDRLMKLEKCKKLNIGDEIIFHRVGAYTITFGGPFIRYYPDVYVNSKGSIKMVRKRMDVEDYYKIHNYEE